MTVRPVGEESLLAVRSRKRQRSLIPGKGGRPKFERWIQVDPAAAVEFVKTCKSRSFQQDSSHILVSTLAQKDPDRAILELEKMPKRKLRQSAGAAMLGELAKHDPSMACDLAERETSQGGYGDWVIGQIFAVWAKTDPEAAAARLATMLLDKVGPHSASELATNWAKSDPEAALKWMKTRKRRRKCWRA